MFTKSGNPGYLVDQPILAGLLQTDQATNKYDVRIVPWIMGEEGMEGDVLGRGEGMHCALDSWGGGRYALCLGYSGVGGMYCPLDSEGRGIHCALNSWGGRGSGLKLER